MNFDRVLKEIKDSAKSPRTLKSLEIIQKVCKEEVLNKTFDFSVTNIGEKSESLGGIKTQPIRNKSGQIYRDLIHLYTKEYQQDKQMNTSSLTDKDSWVSGINDPATKYLIEMTLRENRELKAETNILRDLERQKEPLIIQEVNKYGKRLEGEKSESELIDQQHFLSNVEIVVLEDLVSKRKWESKNCIMGDDGNIYHEDDEDTSLLTKGDIAVIQKMKSRLTNK